MDFFLQLDIIYVQLITVTTWFISVPNINQSTFGIDQMELYGPLQYSAFHDLYMCVGIRTGV